MFLQLKQFNKECSSKGTKKKKHLHIYSTFHSHNRTNRYRTHKHTHTQKTRKRQIPRIRSTTLRTQNARTVIRKTVLTIHCKAHSLMRPAHPAGGSRFNSGTRANILAPRMRVPNHATAAPHMHSIFVIINVVNAPSTRARHARHLHTHTRAHTSAR